MKKIYLVLVVALSICIGACKGQNSYVHKDLPVAGFAKTLANAPDAQLVDVRTPDEYAEGHLKGAVNINYNADDFTAKAAKLDKGRPVMVYCLSGGRSAFAAAKLDAMGFAHVYNMEGGIEGWEEAGKPLEHAFLGSSLQGLTTASLAKLTTGSKMVLVDYTAVWCGPCKKMMPMLEALAERKKEALTLMKIDADDNKGLLKEKSISSIPYLELYKDGNLVWSHTGYMEEDELLREAKL